MSNNIKKSLGRIFRIMLNNISPTLNIKYLYKKNFGNSINLKNPRTFDEKIQWLKLHIYQNNSLITDCTDKFKVRNYIRACGCEEILNELYYAYDSPDDIDWELLPNKFVLKWNFGCGQNFICHDKSKYNETDVKTLLKKWLKLHKTFYKEYSELQYKGIAPKLLCEKLIETDNGLLPKDYKIYCFNGEPCYALVCTDRSSQGHTHYYFFDENWQLQRLNRMGLNAPEDFTLPKPTNYEQLFKYARILAKPFAFVRVDFYLERGKVIFGELTFTPSAGFDKGRLPSTQELFGNKLILPTLKNKKHSHYEQHSHMCNSI